MISFIYQYTNTPDPVFGGIGNCEWLWGYYQCSAYWDPVDKIASSSAQTATNVEWGWSTMFNRFNTYRDVNGKEQNFLTEKYFKSKSYPETDKCYYSNTKNSDMDKGAYDVKFIDQTKSEISNIYLVLDKSGSMRIKEQYSNTVGMQSYSRLVVLKTAVRDFITKSITEIKKRSIHSVNLGVITFNHDWSCFGIEDDPCGRSDIETRGNDLEKYIFENLVADGNTNIVEATYAAAEKLVNINETGPEFFKKIYLVTDGHDNQSNMDRRKDVVQYIIDNAITIYAMAIGNDADDLFLQALTKKTGGVLVYSKEANSVVNDFHRMVNDSRGGQSIIALEEGIILPKYQSNASIRKFIVSEESGFVDILLTNNERPIGGSIIDDANYFWNPEITIIDPNGTQYKRSKFSPNNDVFTYILDNLVSVHITPAIAGEWTIKMSNFYGCCEAKGNLTVTTRNHTSNLSVNATPSRIRDNEQTTITPGAYYGDMRINMNNVSCSGVVISTTGNRQNLVFTNEPSRDSNKLAPYAKIGAFDGRGFYSVELTCDIPAMRGGKSGEDTVIIYNVCELVAGKYLNC